MPAITKTTIGNGRTTLAETTLDGATDSFGYKPSGREVLILRNPTAGALSPVIDGDAAGTVQVPGVGPIDISGGYGVGSIAAGAVATVNLDSIARYLDGTISITGGTGLVATLLSF